MYHPINFAIAMHNIQPFHQSYLYLNIIFLFHFNLYFYLDTIKTLRYLDLYQPGLLFILRHILIFRF
jgi:hypothetical protein